MPRHNDGHAPLVSVHSGAGHGGAHLPPEKRAGRPGWWLALLGLVLAAAVVAVIVVVAFRDSPDESRDSSSPSQQASGSAPGSPDEQALDERALADCRAQWQAVQEVLAAAEPSMRQWETHVVAMNQLVAGKITLAQASAFWERTRVAARTRYDAFASVDREVRPRPCRAAESAAPESGELAACARAVAAADRTLAAARTTLARWDRHITDMNRMRDGMLSPAMAQQMWVASWRRGVVELRVYHDRERASLDQQCPA